MKHRVKIVQGDYAVHHVSPAYPKMFIPRCSCNWEGAWVETRETALRHGSEHFDKATTASHRAAGSMHDGGSRPQ
jgi:hypothetical protein